MAVLSVPPTGGRSALKTIAIAIFLGLPKSFTIIAADLKSTSKTTADAKCAELQKDHPLPPLLYRSFCDLILETQEVRENVLQHASYKAEGIEDPSHLDFKKGLSVLKAKSEAIANFRTKSKEGSWMWSDYSAWKEAVLSPWREMSKNPEKHGHGFPALRMFAIHNMFADQWVMLIYNGNARPVRVDGGLEGHQTGEPFLVPRGPRTFSLDGKEDYHPLSEQRVMGDHYDRTDPEKIYFQHNS